jgi:hypothetical protein
MNKYILAIVVALSVSNVYAESIVDITKIAGKSEKSVAAYLGKPISCSTIKYGKKCLYKMRETEVVFIESKADWITVQGLDLIPFSKAALSALGLKEATPSFSNKFTLRWESIQGLMEVAIFNGTSSSDYAYIKVRTK